MDGLYDQVRIAIHQVWRRRWLAIAVAWGVAVAGWLVVALIPSTYEAKARLFVQMQSILPNQVGVTPDERNNQLLRLRQTLTSNENLIRVVRRTDLNSLADNEAELGRVVSALRTRITVTTQPDGMIEIKATSNISGFSNGQNARTAAASVQGLIDMFIEQNLSGDRRETGQSLTFLDEELARRETALARGRAAADGVRAALYRACSPATGRSASAWARPAPRSPIWSSRSSPPRARSTRCAPSFSRRRRAMPGLDGGASGTATGQIAQLEAQIAQARGRGWTDSHPDIVAARQQIARLRPYAQGERQRGGTRRRGDQPQLYLAARHARRARGAARRRHPAAQPAPVRSRPALLAPVLRARPRRRAGAAGPRLQCAEAAI